jgi:peptidoglycan/LPS O-acetylase OafA/YrhL
MRRPAIPSLTSLRFFAAMAVVLFHYGATHGEMHFYLGTATFGYQAVTFFFLLSGFILTYTHHEGDSHGTLNVSPGMFLRLRLARLAPAYYFALVLGSPFLVSAFLKHQDPTGVRFWLEALLVTLGMQSWYPPAALFWNNPAWSLSVEIFLYLSFLPLIRLTASLQNDRLLMLAFSLVILATVVNAICTATLGEGIREDVFWHNFLLYFPLWYLPQFMLGVAIARIQISAKNFSPTIHEGILAISLIAVFAIMVSHDKAPALSSNVIMAPLFGAMIYGAAGAQGWVTALLSHRWLVRLGEASFAVYIIHAPTWIWWNHAVSGPLVRRFGLVVEFWSFLLLLLVVSVLVFERVEVPGRRWLLKNLPMPTASLTKS